MEAACIANIGPAQRRRRVGVGVVGLLVSAAVAAVLIATGTPRLARLGLFPLLWTAALGFFQAREKT